VQKSRDAIFAIDYIRAFLCLKEKTRQKKQKNLGSFIAGADFLCITSSACGCGETPKMHRLVMHFPRSVFFADFTQNLRIIFCVLHNDETGKSCHFNICGNKTRIFIDKRI
jgi:hypothetical protein